MPAYNTPNNDAPSFDMAKLKLDERTIVVAQARPLLIEKRGGRACVVGRDVMRHCVSVLGKKSEVQHDQTKDVCGALRGALDSPKE